MSLLQELRRRKVFRLAALYIVGAWVVLQVADLAFESWDIASSALRYVWFGAIFGFPIALVFAWRYDITAQGILRTPPADVGEQVDLSLRRSDYVILAALVAVIAGIVYPLTIQIGDSGFARQPGLAEGDLEPNSIAVLPFENVSGDPEQAYFVSGMQNALIAGLSRISALKVTSKTSTLRYRNTVESLPVIAAQLGVAKLIEGSIFRVEDRVRITVTLINAALDEHIWSETFEHEVKDVMLLQNEVSMAIAEQVEVAIRPEEQDQLDSSKIVDPAAYEAFLKGQFHVERFTPQDIKLAAQYFQQAVEIEPDNALAHAGLAKLCAFQAQAGIIRPQVARERCLPSIVTALDLDSSLPDAQAAYATHMTWLLYNWDEGGAAFQRAIELNPSYAEARMFYSHYLTLLGHIEAGSEQMRLALELDPLNPFVQSLHGVQLYMAGDPRGCIRVIEEVMASTPGFGFGHGVLASAYHDLGEQDKAIAALSNELRIIGFPEGAQLLNSAYAESGYSHAMIRVAEALEERSRTIHVGPLSIGGYYEFAGEFEKAIDWYRTGFRITGPSVPYLGALTQLSAIRFNPRFIKLLRDAGLDFWADKYSQAAE
jgi:TolB-like protein